ncbi:Fibronectin type III domain-containing protein [Glycomyces sambucus]|uniref:Fibronectin type III domain-containing protein n=1 Tax=Glycomyces sambucus TaxID=380244 RepID=A0A1G9LLH3_9ACTN|nr:fibronectin type III domain-containing protein [Glycomyces sambucus]SDL62355.1 Fibronectin type III domain-containing protein [Glycomyces sambucus]
MTTSNVDARRLNVKGLLIAVGLPVVLVGALVATLLGTGAFSRENEGEDASLWLWTTPLGELARVNGLTAATDVRLDVTDAMGNAVQVEQTDSHLLLREIATGKVSAIDLSTLELTGSAETAPGEGVRVALSDEGAFIIDQTQGLVNQVDPSTLSAIGDPLQFPAGLTGGAFDGDGMLWIGVPREGTIVQIEPRDSGAKTLATEVVAQPRQELALTVLGDGVAVLNSTAKEMTTIRTDGRRAVTSIELAGPTETADTSPGTIASVTVTDPPSVVTVDDDQTRTFQIAAGASELLGASVEFHERIYVPDGASGIVWVYDLEGNELNRIEIDSGGGPVELYHTGDTLFANAVNTNAAVVVSADGTAALAPKNRDDILGGDAPPTEEDEGGDDEGEEEGDEESAPEVGPPGAVTNLDGTVGDGLINLSWDAAPNNGSALTKYVVEGAGETWEIAPSQRVLEIGDLDNGQPYTFTVTAHNAEGAGDTVTSPSITPSADVPGAPGAVTATANPDGTVTVNWEEADGEGNDISGYQVEAIASGGEQVVVGQATGTELKTAAGTLDYGTQYAFQVTTLAGAAASAPSPLSASVTPFNVPDAPGELFAESSTSAAGTIDVRWTQPSNNGRDIQKYVVTAGSQTVEVTGTTASLSGFGNNENVSVSVVAVNEAGQSEPATTTSNTMAAPTVQISGHESLGDTINLTLAIDDGGSADAQCTLLADGVNQDTKSCPDVYSVTGLYASTDYSFQIRISNPAGEATSNTYNASTAAINGEVFFGCDSMSTDYCDSVDGVSVYSAPSGGSNLGVTNTGDRYKAYCWTTGANTITPRGQESDGYHDYHEGKDGTNKWIKIDYASNAYIPFAWINIDGQGKNSTGDLPQC